MRDRTAPGATKSKVLAALANGDAMTAGEVAAATGIHPGMLTSYQVRQKTGEVLKADAATACLNVTTRRPRRSVRAKLPSLAGSVPGRQKARFHRIASN